MSQKNNLALIFIYTALIILFAGMFFLAKPSILGFVTSEKDYSVPVEKVFTSSETLSIEGKEIGYFAINGWINKGFFGKIYLNDATQKYLLLDYSVSNLDEKVEGSVINFGLISEEITPEVTALKVSSDFNNDSPVCTRWFIISNSKKNELCYGSSSCCNFLGLSQDEQQWNEPLYINQGKHGAGARNIIKAQLIYANYSVDLQNPYSDIRYSDIKGVLVDLFLQLNFSDLCGEACNIVSSGKKFTLDIEIDSGSFYFKNYTYKKVAAVELEKPKIKNSAPIFTALPNITLTDSYTLDLSKYVTDSDGDNLDFSYFDVDNINIKFDGFKALISPTNNFSGKVFTFFKANDSKDLAVSNVIQIEVINNASTKIEQKIISEANKTEENISVNQSMSLNLSVVVNNESICSSDEVLIRAFDNDKPISFLPANTTIYIKYRKGTGKNKENVIASFNETNNFTACIKNASDQITARVCGPENCAQNKYIEKELGNNVNSLNGKVNFITKKVDMKDQYGSIISSHKFYHQAFMNIYSSNNKLVFGCGDCNSQINALKSGDSFIVPYGSRYKYKSSVKTNLSSNNNVDGDLIEVNSSDEEIVSATLRNINVTLFDQNDSISVLDSKYNDLSVDIIKFSNNKILWQNLKSNNNYLIPNNIIYKTQEKTLPFGTKNEIKGDYNIINSSEQNNINPIFQKINVITLNENCTETNVTGYIVKPSNGKTLYQITKNGYFYAPLNSEIKYKLKDKELLGPIKVLSNLTQIKIVPKKEIECNGCRENWIISHGDCLKNDTKMKLYMDTNNCGTAFALPKDNGTHIGCDYCVLAWVEMNTSCREDDTKIGYYYDINSCFEKTQLVSDLIGKLDNKTYKCDYCTPIWHEINTTCLPNDKIVGWYNDSNDCYNITGLDSDNNPLTNNTYPCDYIVSNNFLGETTVFSDVNLSNMQHLILHAPNYGKINFSETVGINRSIDLDSNIIITNNSIFMNSAALPEFNKSAILRLYNLNFVNPIILMDGSECPSDICTKISYTAQTLVFNVSHFTTYSSMEGPYCGDGLCNNGETCSTCSSDCGICSGGGGSRKISESRTQTAEPSKKEVPIKEVKEQQTSKKDAQDIYAQSETNKPNEEETLCNYKLEVSLPEKISFIKENSIAGKIINKGNCNIEEISLDLSPDLKEVANVNPPYIRGFEKGDNIAFNLNKKIEKKARNLLTGAVTSTSKSEKIINGNMVIKASSGQQQVLKQELLLNVNIIAEKEIVDKYLVGYWLMVGVSIFVITKSLLLMFKSDKKPPKKATRHRL